MSSNSNNTTSLAENKVLILYIFYQIYFTFYIFYDIIAKN